MSKKKKINYDLGENIHDDVHRRRINWFPGHMNKAIKEVAAKLKQVDIVLEIRDARAPLTTGNSEFDRTVGEKSRLVLFNKTNLAVPAMIDEWKIWFDEKKLNHMFINALDEQSLKLVITRAKEIVLTKILESNPDYKQDKKFRMMIIGLPNTGKSTIINKLAKRNASKAADKPGQTQNQLWVKVDSQLDILDTPGIMPPKIAKHEHGLWLAAIHAIPSSIVDKEDSACFIIKYLIEKNSDEFFIKYNFESRDQDLYSALDHIAKLRGCMKQKGEFDYERVYQVILSDFRSGELGLISFGLPPVK